LLLVLFKFIFEMAAKRGEGGGGRLFQDHCKRPKTGGEDSLPTPVPGVEYSGHLSAEARKTCFDKVEYWWDLLNKYFEKHYAATPKDKDASDIYTSSHLLVIALQADLLIDAVERGPFPNSVDNREIFDIPKYFMQMFMKGDDRPDPDDVRFTYPSHATGPEVLASVKRGWATLLALKTKPQLQGQLKSKEDIQADLDLTFMSLTSYCGGMDHASRRAGGKKPVLPRISLEMVTLLQRARAIGMDGPSIRRFLWFHY
jgi:hypothetical protein